MGFGFQDRHSFAGENALPSVAIRLLAIQSLPASGFNADLGEQRESSVEVGLGGCGGYTELKSGAPMIRCIRLFNSLCSVICRQLTRQCLDKLRQTRFSQVRQCLSQMGPLFLAVRLPPMLAFDPKLP